MLRHPEDRERVVAEMKDLLESVPSLQGEYRLLDRLGEGKTKLPICPL
jgi:hypothetical protein